MPIRCFLPGDETAQAAIYNAVAGSYPGFKPATVEEIHRRTSARDFDPTRRFYAVEGDRVVGYVTLNRNGRVSVPWCLRGHEAYAEPLFEAVVDRAEAEAIPRLFAAYRADWTVPAAFLTAHQFRVAREMVNFLIEALAFPTQSNRSTFPRILLTPDRLPELYELGRSVFGSMTQEEVGRYYFANPLFSAQTLFGLTSKADGQLVAVCLLVLDPSYADPRKVDPKAPCFRLGAFGNERMELKRIDGTFSFLARTDRNPMPIALELLSHISDRIADTKGGVLASQIASDSPYLRFYSQYFQRQGAFPVFERDLTP